MGRIKSFYLSAPIKEWKHIINPKEKSYSDQAYALSIKVHSVVQWRMIPSRSKVIHFASWEYLIFITLKLFYLVIFLPWNSFTLNYFCLEITLYKVCRLLIVSVKVVQATKCIFLFGSIPWNLRVTWIYSDYMAAFSCFLKNCNSSYKSHDLL